VSLKELEYFKSGLQFDFSNHRSRKLNNLLSAFGLGTKKTNMLTKDGRFDQGRFNKYVREEGVNEFKIARVVKRQFNRAYDVPALIDQLK